MGMAFIKRPFKRHAEGGGAAATDSYIDLGALALEEEGGALGEPARAWVKVAEVYRWEDVNDLMTHVYNGNVLLLDFTAVANDDLALKRLTSELKAAARDTGGDVAVVGKNWMVATPAAMKIDRTKIKGSY